MTAEIEFRTPVSTDGVRVHRLVEACPPLDRNSVYCNLLQCTHFARTAMVAEINGEMVGFVSGFLVPDRPKVYFLWQVMVGENGRRKGLARQMIIRLLQRLGPGVNYLETTVTPDNKASAGMFRSLAKHLGTTCSVTPFFDKDNHFRGRHESEHLFSIGPIAYEELNKTIFDET